MLEGVIVTQALGDSPTLEDSMPVEVMDHLRVPVYQWQN
jgi:hypothetical protein